MKIDNIEYRITRKARCRRVTLTVAHSGEVLVTAPGRIREKNIRKFLESEQTIRWVRDSLAQHEKMRQRFLPNGLSEGASFPYLGQNRRVEVIENGPAVVDLAGEKFLVRLPWGLGDREKERRIAWMLTGWYKARAAELLAERVSAIGARTG
ncbi:MAG: YgjP-like metallopeptidase domain-containing protein, partial [Gemmatimonadota bacterium]|nr:YgjP-like metallopeptidase domain-containing protein [Gemmatimonadota bacterium]